MAWKEWEDKILEQVYPCQGGIKVQDLLPHKNIYQIRRRLKKLGIYRQGYRRWEEADSELLIENFPQLGYERIAEVFPDRSPHTVRNRVSMLGLTKREYPRWTQQEIKILLRWYPKIGVNVCKRLPGRTPSAAASKYCRLTKSEAS